MILLVGKVYSRRGVKGLVVAGDLNFPEIDWETYYGSQVAIDQMF